MRINELPVKDVLERAIAVVGSKRDLCSALWISEAELEAYLAGRQEVTDAVYFGALDLLV
jgi:hypothetical protein